jgi:hypothetical protein
MHDVDRGSLIAAFRGGDLVAFGRVWDRYFPEGSEFGKIPSLWDYAL